MAECRQKVYRRLLNMTDWGGEAQSACLYWTGGSRPDSPSQCRAPQAPASVSVINGRHYQRFEAGGVVVVGASSKNQADKVSIAAGQCGTHSRHALWRCIHLYSML